VIEFTEKDPYAPIAYVYEISDVLFDKKTAYQRIQVVENRFFGRMLLLDGIVQITDKDEFFYHEMLAHPVLHAHPDPRRVVVIGGGDGGTVREVLKHDTVEKVFFIEIDEEVIETSRRFFPKVSAGIDDPRVEVRPMDGAEFVKELADEVDAIIVDSTDIVGFAKVLFEESFFRSVNRALRAGGVYASHTESLHFHLNIVREVQEVLRRVFPVVDLYTASIATYGGNWWAFGCASKGGGFRDKVRPCKVPTRFYDEEVHRQAFLTPRLYDRLLRGELDW